MIRVLRSEWIKLHTVTMNWVLGAIAVLLPLAVTLLTAFFNGTKARFDAQELLDPLAGSTVVTCLLCGVIAAAGITGEFGFNTIRPTFAATPRRWVVILAKALVGMVTSAVLAAAILAVGLLAGRAIAEGRGATIELGDVPTMWPAFAGIVGFATSMAIAGHGLGLILRSTPAAITILVIWLLLGERLVAGIIGAITDSPNVPRWMPFQAGLQSALLEGSFEGPSRLAGALYFASVALVLMVIGGVLVNRRDA